MSGSLRLPIIPASLFGIVPGVLGLGTAWRIADKVLGAPKFAGEAIMFAGTLVWATVLVLYGAKWVVAGAAAVAEAAHAVECCSSRSSVSPLL
jgi:tellurite resistance protein